MDINIGGYPWSGMAAELVGLMLLMGGLALYQRWRPLQPETSRKLFHVAGGLSTLAFPWIFPNAWPVVLLTLVIIPSLLALKYMRTFKQNLGTVLYRIDRRSFGEVYFPLSVCLVFVLAHGNALLFCIPVLLLTLADPMAALIGSRYGRLRYHISSSQKSVEGSATFLIVAFACIVIPLLLFSQLAAIAALIIAAMVGLLVMLAEAVAWEGLDNFLIPLVGFFLLQALLPLEQPVLMVLLTLSTGLVAGIFWLTRRATIQAARFMQQIPNSR